MKLSIITINFNDATGLERTIKSIISQSFRDFEYIIIDGGSSDGSVDIIKQYEKVISYWISEPDGGIYPAMNKGLCRAKGEYINFMNAGDYFHSSDVLEKVFSINPNADIITGRHTENGAENIGEHGDVSFYDLYRCAIDHQASFIRRDLALRHPYDEKYRIVSDWKFFIEALIIDNCSFHYTNIIIVDVDMKGISNTNMELNYQEREAVLKELFPKRVLADYKVMTSIHPTLLEISTRITKSQKIRKIILCFANILLKIKGL